MAQSTLTGQAQPTATPVRPAAANKRVKFILGTVVIFIAIGFLIFNAVGETGQYYLTVTELQERGVSMVGRPARVSGFIIPTSVDWNAPELILKFSIEDENGALPIVFHGPMPDNMTRPDAEAIVEGKLQEDGTFKATTLLVKCPSRYEEMEIQEVKAID